MRATWAGEIDKNKEEKIVKIRQWKQSHLTNLSERNFTAHQEALLSAVILDRRHNGWACEMLRRRNAVARWRGQPGCSVREIIEAIGAMPIKPSLGAELPKESPELEAA